MAKIVGICNQKGGTGKSTAALNMAAGLHQYGKRVLVVDLDPQASVTTCFGIEPAELDKTIAGLIDAQIRRVPLPDIRETILDVEGIHLLPSNIELSVIDNAIVTATSREYILKKILSPILPLYDYLLLDCLPSLGMLNFNALTAADTLIIPVKAGFLDVKGLELLLGTIEMVITDLNPSLTIGGVLVTMFDSRLNLAKDARAAVREFCVSYSERFTAKFGRPFAIPVFETAISTSVKAQESTVKRQNIFDFNPKCKTALEYGAVVREVLDNGL